MIPLLDSGFSLAILLRTVQEVFSFADFFPQGMPHDLLGRQPQRTHRFPRGRSLSAHAGHQVSFLHSANIFDPCLQLFGRHSSRHLTNVDSKLFRSKHMGEINNIFISTTSLRPPVQRSIAKAKAISSGSTRLNYTLSLPLS